MSDLTIEEVAADLRLSEEAVRRLLRKGLLVGYKAGVRSWRVRPEDLAAFKASGGTRGKRNG